MKGKEKLIGVIVGLVLAAIVGALGLQSDEFKEGLCGSSKPSAQIPVAQPSPQ